MKNYGHRYTIFSAKCTKHQKRDHFLRNHNTFLLKHNNKEDDKEEVWHESLDCHFGLFSCGVD